MKKFYILLISTSFLALTSCNDLDLIPTDRETEETFWDKPEDALNVLNNCYENMYNAEYYFFNETLSDNAFNKSEVDGSNSRNIAEGSYDASQARIRNEWGYHYTGIRKCNILLTNIDKVPGMDEALKARVKAEAQFIRAFHYFNLTVWYGDVPLVDNVLSVEESQSVSRSSQADIVNFINADLDFAAANLPIYTDYAEGDRGRIAKGAALALKARLASYLGNWQDVATITDQIINGEAGAYGLFNSYSGLFLPQNEYNQEVILDLQYVPVQRTYQEQRFFIPKTEGKLVTSIAPTQELVDAYPMINGMMINEAGSGFDAANPYAGRDPRFQATIVYDGYQWKRPDGSIVEIRTFPGTGDNSIDKDDASPTGYYFAKYYDPTADADNRAGLNLILIRYAEVLLMNAEAKLELGQMTADVWNKTVRTIRERAGFTDPNALNFNTSWDDTALRNIVRNERRVEFALEGLRIFDIRRWKTAEVVLNGWAHGIKVGDPSVDNGFKRVDFRTFDPAKHYLWPIPQRERDLNQNLSQNPNW
ncbi:MAG TPA: RagB/SusD family nutrient uptake outer membrane protein [Cytophagales bacterium]|nr:RagB/SusD family nutrient uptake outer membrane protein [Cytophagales bacterium]